MIFFLNIIRSNSVLMFSNEKCIYVIYNHAKSTYVLTGQIVKFLEVMKQTLSIFRVLNVALAIQMVRLECLSYTVTLRTLNIDNNMDGNIDRLNAPCE